MNFIENTIKKIKDPCNSMYHNAKQRLRQQARPAGSLGVLEEIAARLSGIFNTLNVRLQNKIIITCAGDHGVCEEGVSVFTPEVTRQMVCNFLEGGASINVLARHAGAKVVVADLGVNYSFDPCLPILHKKIGKGTANFTKGPAMTYDDAIKSIEAGIAIVKQLHDKDHIHLIGTGDMGIGNTTPSSAIIAVFSGLCVDQLTGKGAGVDNDGLKRKIEVIKQGISVNKPDRNNPVDVLAKVGGFEIGGIAGIVIGAASNGIPVVCDGFISTAGALIACELAPAAKKYLFAGHNSVEAGHRYMLDYLGLEALLDLKFRLGEGTGAALSMELIDAATRILFEIKTFQEVEIQDTQK